MPTRRMGPPPGASHGSSPWAEGHADAHDCIMVRIKRSYRIQVCSARSAPMASSPSDYQSDMQCVPSDAQLQKAPSRWSSSLCVLRRQGAAKHKRRYAASRQALLAFRSLDPFRALRKPGRWRRGEERLFGSVEDWRAGWPRHPDRATFPAPSTSHAACGFPALRAPICFTSGLMGPIILGQLSVRRVALDSC